MAGCALSEESGLPVNQETPTLPEPSAKVAGGCVQPIRLAGHTDHVDVASGEVRRAFTSAGQPGGVVHVRCNNRREAVCPACSATYRRDARRIVLAGMADGQGVPESVVGHPALFVTLTAPSFGPVHSRRSKGKNGQARACRPRRGECPHGRPAGCHARHGDGDRQLGQPLCPDCFDYPGAVIWNTLAPKLWKVTRDRVESAVAAAAGLTVAGLRRQVRITCVKAAELQARGLVHLHAVIRIDGCGDGPDNIVAPPAWATMGPVAECLRAVVAEVAVSAPDPADPSGRLAVRWGEQVDIRPIVLDGPTTSGKIANYLAKYLTKSATAGGALDRPVRSLAHLARLPLNAHARRMVETCWQLGQDERYAAALDEAAGRHPGRLPGLLRWSHAFGWGVHWITKSRRYSTTFVVLRGARRVYARTVAAALSDGLPVDAFGRPDGDPRTVVVGAWRYAGRGAPADAVPPGGPPSVGPSEVTVAVAGGGTAGR
ncbi:replication initiation protein [Candidatus Protofrankia californiensis]|uniref:Replication initiation protein n=1 Tax=Candidatus Protofrankia californiensis TaxID=1839754 RepID=A0A1C3P4H4_9ACTN|nr:replication initiation protein [Candidatus Protofrankia californiensis]